jgi:lysozyme family protein
MTIDDVISDVLKREGGFVNDPADKGSATNMGITAATLGAYRKLGRSATAAEVQALGEPEARAIYLQRYVLEPGFDELPEWAIPLVVDDAVLSGPKVAIQTLQRAIGGVADDGVLGPATVKALASKDPAAMTRELVKARALRFARIVETNPTQAKFIRGWLTRAFQFLA